MVANELDFLYEIQTSDAFCPMVLPGYDNKKGHYIDLKTRNIDAPEILSVQKDHNSNVIYFVVDRFFDYMDLSKIACVIQYITPDGETHIYPVPYYDIYSFNDLECDGPKMIIPWNVDSFTTDLAGEVEYSFRFFKIVDNGTNRELVYNLNTSPAKSKILMGLNVNIPLDEDTDISTDENIDIPLDGAETPENATQAEKNLSYHAQVYEILAQRILENQTYWTVVGDI